MTGRLAPVVPGAEPQFQPIAGEPIIAEKSDAFTKVGDDEIEVAVIVKIGHGSSATDMGSGERRVQRCQIVKRLALAVPKEERRLGGGQSSSRVLPLTQSRSSQPS